MPNFLHNHSDFASLIGIVGQNLKIDPVPVEKDYWIMHCLYGLQEMGLSFELKGGTSLSKGYGIIQRFSEDIDIRIEPPADRAVKIGRNHNKLAHCISRKDFYDWLAETIAIDGIVNVERDVAFDDDKYRSGGIRLYYKNATGLSKGIKHGILLEVGFDDVKPNEPRRISSWAFDHAANMDVDVIDNRAKLVACYIPGYTLVEKLQAISTKFRMQQSRGTFPSNFIRHYYDVYRLLQDSTVQTFIGSPDYLAHKKRRFRKEDQRTIAVNPAFALQDDTYQLYEREYLNTSTLYYSGQPAFRTIMDHINVWSHRL